MDTDGYFAVNAIDAGITIYDFFKHPVLTSFSVAYSSFKPFVLKHATQTTKAVYIISGTLLFDVVPALVSAGFNRSYSSSDMIMTVGKLLPSPIITNEVERTETKKIIATPAPDPRKYYDAILYGATLVVLLDYPHNTISENFFDGELRYTRDKGNASIGNEHKIYRQFGKYNYFGCECHLSNCMYGACFYGTENIIFEYNGYRYTIDS